jgi:peptidoglycan/LPS O-acetylase OafA/YrhL
LITKNNSTPVSHANNFDFLRLVFATLVLYSHSYALTDPSKQDILARFSHDQAVMSSIGLLGFFILSGYLILTSLLRSRDLKDYFFKRIIRVFPALWVVVGVSMIGGYFFAHKSAADYFTQPSFYKYALTAVLRIQYDIGGVFENNPHPRAINGSLWTVPYEFLFYILLSVLFVLRENRTALRIIVVGAFSVMLVARILWHGWIFMPLLNMSVDQTLTFAVCFSAGAALALFKLPSERVRAGIAAVCAVALVLVLWIGGFRDTQYILLPPLVIYFGTLRYKLFGWVRRFGDISYGIYIWGFPIQQAIWYFLHPSPIEMFCLSAILVYIVAYASWHLIEKQALKLKLPKSQPVQVVQ